MKTEYGKMKYTCSKCRRRMEYTLVHKIVIQWNNGSKNKIVFCNQCWIELEEQENLEDFIKSKFKIIPRKVIKEDE